jgi:hypothetical protein
VYEHSEQTYKFYKMTRNQSRKYIGRYVYTLSGEAIGMITKAEDFGRDNQRLHIETSNGYHSIKTPNFDDVEALFAELNFVIR